MKPGTTANQITAELLVKLPKRFPQSMVWRNNSGKGLGWSVVKAVIACLRQRDIDAALKLLTRPISFGMVGSPDVIGMIRVPGVTGATPLAIFIGFEIKVNDKQSPEQIAFELRTKELGAIYLVCRDVDVCLDELEWTLNVAGRAA